MQIRAYILLLIFCGAAAAAAENLCPEWENPLTTPNGVRLAKWRFSEWGVRQDPRKKIIRSARTALIDGKPAVTLESSFGEQTTCKRMSHYAVIPFKYPHRPVHKPREKEGSKVQLIDSQMIKNRETVPHKAVPYVIYYHLICHLNFRSVSQAAGKGIVPAMHTEYIHLTFTRSGKVLHSVVYCIEEPLSIKRAALEYDCDPKH